MKRLFGGRQVLALAIERRLIFCWQHKLYWNWRSFNWPSDACRDGTPMQREVMTEVLEELFLDSDVAVARLELLLSVDGIYWRILEGFGADVFDSDSLSEVLSDGLDWPLDPLESYVVATPCANGFVAVRLDAGRCL